MPSTYRITEPHPSVPSSKFGIAVGRGGAGNYALVPKHITPGADATGPASRTKLLPPSNGRYLSGRGGAGNFHTQRERAIFSFDEELERQRKMMEHQAPVYHVGRGGAGNFATDYSSSSASTKKDRQNSTSSISSSESTHSRVSAAYQKLRKTVQ